MINKDSPVIVSCLSLLSWCGVRYNDDSICNITVFIVSSYSLSDFSASMRKKAQMSIWVLKITTIFCLFCFLRCELYLSLEAWNWVSIGIFFSCSVTSRWFTHFFGVKFTLDPGKLFLEVQSHLLWSINFVFKIFNIIVIT